MTLDGRNRKGEEAPSLQFYRSRRLSPPGGLVRIFGSFRSVSQGVMPTVGANRGSQTRGSAGSVVWAEFHGPIRMSRRLRSHVIDHVSDASRTPSVRAYTR